MRSTSCAAIVLVVDASALYEVLAVGERSDSVRAVLGRDDQHAAPQLIDAEVVAVAQAHERRGVLDPTAASLVVDGLRRWPGERWPHRHLVERTWQLRRNVRAYDAFYVALAESLGATLVTLDGRLASARGITCPLVVPDVG